MMETKFTPGPWFSHRYLGTDENYFVRGPNDERVCGQGAGMVSEANANLIASAPDLYEACEAMLEAWFDYHDRHSLTEAVTGRSGNAADLAIAALAKARGEPS